MKMTTSMLRHCALCLTVLLFGTTGGRSATLSRETPLHLKADASSAIVASLPSGTAITVLHRDELAAEGISALPPGWAAVRYSGPVYGYALNSAVGKDFSLKPGAIVRAQPSADAPMFSMVGDGDRAEVVELAGDWSKVVFEKNMVLFLRTDGASGQPGSEAETPRLFSTPVAVPAAAPESQAAPVTARPATDTTPRVFQGYLTRTRRILGAGPKLDYQLVDRYNKRIALLDFSALLLTDPIDRFEERQVSVFGVPTSPEGVKDVVIRVETVRLVE